MQWRRTRTLSRCSPWWIARSGPDRVFRSRQSRHRCRRCLPSLKGWDMRCDRLLVRQTNRRDLHKHRSPPDRDITHLFGRDATSPESSVSAAVRSDIRKLVAQSRIRRYRSSHRAGTCSQMINNSGTPIPGKRHLDRGLTQTGLNAIHQDYVSSSSPDSTHISEIFNSHHKSDSVIRNSVLFLDQNIAESTGAPRAQTTDSLTISDRVDTEPVETTQTGSLMDQPDYPYTDHVDDSVLQISGAGHWFLEGWIGDHSVEFLVDSGSSVTAMSDSLYQTLIQTGAPVGALGYTSRTLCGANGTGIGVSGDALTAWYHTWDYRRSFPYSFAILRPELMPSL